LTKYTGLNEVVYDFHDGTITEMTNKKSSRRIPFGIVDKSKLIVIGTLTRCPTYNLTVRTATNKLYDVNIFVFDMYLDSNELYADEHVFHCAMPRAEVSKLGRIESTGGGWDSFDYKVSEL
jgi:hypothetical protein